MSITTVAEAEKIIQQQARDYGSELIPLELAIGRVLAADILADRDLPPCNRVTMDGIAIRYPAFENGIRSFRVKATIAAGDKPTDITQDDECVEIMTGGALPDSVDTVIRYEDIEINDGVAAIKTESIRKGQNIHKKGKDKQQGAVVASANQVVDATLISMAASVGKPMLPVKKMPRVVIISTGDELVAIDETPTDWQIRSSNSRTIKAALLQYCVQCDLLHIPDDKEVTKDKIRKCLSEYDVLLLSGGISMGKFDYVPQVLEELSVNKLFHKVQQRPGKPFWFGVHAGGAVVFAFPGNPVSTFLCLHRYFIPWLETSLGLARRPEYHAVLDKDINFTAPLQYFLQVKVTVSPLGTLAAQPIEGNGSGDFANLLDTNAFMELPMEASNFTKGSIYRIWPFKQII